MKKLLKLLPTINLFLSVIAIVLSLMALNWIHLNNQREVATELLLSAKIKCLETGAKKDCNLAKEYAQELKDKAIKFDF
ncbi:MAG: hypothetical protein Q4A27_01940 [bacterium]|nr:hypothetical protein [bacterium]